MKRGTAFQFAYMLVNILVLAIRHNGDVLWSSMDDDKDKVRRRREKKTLFKSKRKKNDIGLIQHKSKHYIELKPNVCYRKFIHNEIAASTKYLSHWSTERKRPKRKRNIARDIKTEIYVPKKINKQARK